MSLIWTGELIDLLTSSHLQFYTWEVFKLSSHTSDLRNGNNPSPGRPGVFLAFPFFRLEEISSMWFVKMYVWSNLLPCWRSCCRAAWGEVLTLSLCFYPWSTSPAAPLSHFVFLGCRYMLSPLRSFSFLDQYSGGRSARLHFLSKQTVFFRSTILQRNFSFSCCTHSPLTVWEQRTTSDGQYVKSG